MNRQFLFCQNEYYHIYNRGTDKREIFLDQNDYNRFVSLLYYANSIDSVRTKKAASRGLALTDKNETLVEIGAWCLMPNHFHILLREKTDGSISRFMQKLTTGYTMYFNKRRERTGTLFQGVFKAEQILNDNHLKYLYSYIHLNPVKLIQSDWKQNGLLNFSKTEKFLKQYKYSSYLDYLDSHREEEKILQKDKFPEYFSSVKEFEKEIFDWLSFNPQEIEINKKA